MNKFSIQQLQQMRESEYRVEFKAGEGSSRLVIGMLLEEGLLISAHDGYQLSEGYYEIVKNVGTVADHRNDDTIIA